MSYCKMIVDKMIQECKVQTLILHTLA